jgi:hypothetical protein
MIYSTNHVSFYEGMFHHGERHGQGTMHYPSGATYYGAWKNGVRHGVGKMKWHSSEESYEGEWDNGQIHGRGRYLWERHSARKDSGCTGYVYSCRNWYEGKRAINPLISY